MNAASFRKEIHVWANKNSIRRSQSLPQKLLFFRLFFQHKFLYQAICTQRTLKGGTQVIVGSINMGYISNTARAQTRNLFRPKCAPIPLGHSGGFGAARFLWSLPQNPPWTLRHLNRMSLVCFSSFSNIGFLSCYINNHCVVSVLIILLHCKLTVRWSLVINTLSQKVRGWADGWAGGWVASRVCCKKNVFLPKGTLVKYFYG